MKESKINQATVQQLRDYLQGTRFRYRTEDDEVGIFSYEKMLPCSVHTLDIHIFVRDDSYSAYGTLPFHLDVKDPVRVQRMCELLTRINYALPNGCFELDLSDGQLRYRVYVSTEGGMVPNREIISTSLVIIESATVYFSNALVRVLFGAPDVPVEKLLERNSHLLDMQLLEWTLRDAARTRAPLERSLGWLTHWLQESDPEESPSGDTPFPEEGEAVGE